MGEREELQYRTELDLKEDFLCKVMKRQAYTPAVKVSPMICLACLVCGAISVMVCIVVPSIQADFQSLIKQISSLVCVFALFFFSRWYSTKITLRRWQEQYHQENVRTYGGFTDAGYVQGRVEKDDGIILHYADINSLTEVDGVWILRTKAGLLAFYNAASLSETDRESALDLLKEKNPKIKIKLPNA